MNKFRMASVDTKATVGLRGLAALHVMVWPFFFVKLKLIGMMNDKTVVTMTLIIKWRFWALILAPLFKVPTPKVQLCLKDWVMWYCDTFQISKSQVPNKRCMTHYIVWPRMTCDMCFTTDASLLGSHDLRSGGYQWLPWTLNLLSSLWLLSYPQTR